MTDPTYPPADDNPYASPRHEIGPAPLASGPPTGVTVTARLMFTGDHLVESLARYRAQGDGRLAWLVGRYVAIAIISLFTAAAIWQQSYFGASLVGMVLVLLLFGQRLQDWQTRRGFNSSPHCNEEITFHLDDAEFRATSDAQDTRMCFTGCHFLRWRRAAGRRIWKCWCGRRYRRLWCGEVLPFNIG